MKTFLKATTTDNTTELFNLDKVISISPRAHGTVKILMGAGLHWHVYADTIEYVDCINDLLKEIQGDN